MFLGTSRWLWLLSGLLVLGAFVGIGIGNLPIGLLLLAAGLITFAVAPTGPSRRGRAKTGEVVPPSSAPPMPTLPTALPPIAPSPPPRRTPLDIEAGDPSQV